MCGSINNPYNGLCMYCSGQQYWSDEFGGSFRSEEPIRRVVSQALKMPDSPTSNVPQRILDFLGSMIYIMWVTSPDTGIEVTIPLWFPSELEEQYKFYNHIHDVLWSALQNEDLMYLKFPEGKHVLRKRYQVLKLLRFTTDANEVNMPLIAIHSMRMKKQPRVHVFKPSDSGKTWLVNENHRGQQTNFERSIFKSEDFPSLCR